MSYELIITEKPNAAKRIAIALAEGKPILERINAVPYYKITRKNKEIIVGCAVGHLFTLDEKEKSGWVYPVFETKWVPSSEKKGSEFSKKYATVLSKLSKNADEFTIATDYDIEGEVIGLNILRFICKRKDANRMKFSTLTRDELIESYEKKQNHIDWGQANAGETRHILDWVYGINLSRALSLSIKHSTGRFKVMSVGRVQGPALKILVDKEKEIEKFVPVPYWQLELRGKKEGEKNQLVALHEKEKFDDKKEAEKILEKTKGHKAFVKKIEEKEFKQAPPVPFDLTTLQTEAYRVFKIRPKDTLDIAQELYIDGLISYPRTSSQVLPSSLNFKKIFDLLSKNNQYTDLVNKIKPPYRPNNGKKTDPAHPAIYPTGELAKLKDAKQKIYDLIVKRFLSSFSDFAVRATKLVVIDVNNENFLLKGTTTKIAGWHDFYKPYLPFKDDEIPNLKENDKIIVDSIDILNKETQPPKRYTQASIISELEKRGLGTKATRAQIIEALYQRGYVNESSIEATKLGKQTVAVLEKYSPLILDEKLTRKFEEEMELIREEKKTEQEVLNEAYEVLKKIIDQFKKHEKEIGKELSLAVTETENNINFIGKCLNCGGDLKQRKGKYGMFVACSNYPKCTVTYALPANAKIKGTEDKCPVCKSPMIIVIKQKKKPQTFCLNVDCETKFPADAEKRKKILLIESGKLELSCPKCKTGKLKVRKSVFGKFLGCDNYPKCKYTEAQSDNNSDNNNK